MFFPNVVLCIWSHCWCFCNQTDSWNVAQSENSTRCSIPMILLFCTKQTSRSPQYWVNLSSLQTAKEDGYPRNRRRRRTCSAWMSYRFCTVIQWLFWWVVNVVVLRSRKDIQLRANMVKDNYIIQAPKWIRYVKATSILLGQRPFVRWGSQGSNNNQKVYRFEILWTRKIYDILSI